MVSMIIFVFLPRKTNRLNLNMRRFLLSTVVFPLFAFVLKAQTAEVSESLTQVYSSTWSRFYSYNYPSKNAAGEDVVLSSMLIAWSPLFPSATDSIESLHIYSHYTITANKQSPTSSDNTQDKLLFGMLVKNSYDTSHTCDYVSRCVVIAPDYQGYGVTRDQSHPYLAQALTAQQVMDGVRYGMELYQKLVADKQALPIKSDWRTFAYGYSQGGAVTLAVQRYIEQNNLSDELHFRGSICADGPYDLLATLRYYLDDNGDSYGVSTAHLKGLSTMPMVIPMIIKGMLDSHPDMKDHSIADYLSQQFLDTGIMDWLSSKDLSTNDISGRWYSQVQEGLEANGHNYSPEQMAELFLAKGKSQVWARLEKVFTPGLYEYLTNPENFDKVPTEKGDACQDLHRALADNSVVTGWEPQHRIQFIHSKGDMVVPYANYLSFLDAHSAANETLFRVDDSSTSDHTAVGTSFFLSLTAMSGFGDYFRWLDESQDATGIMSHQFGEGGLGASGEWYSIDGRRLSGRPAQRGVYIRNGKKMLINK